MDEVSIFEIKKQADNMIAAGAKWHFHILTPRCMFNGRPQYAFVLENSSENKVFIHYSIQPQKELGEELVKKLHGEKISENSNNDTQTELSEQEKKVIAHAKTLTKENKDWHHHMLFPDCTFNESDGKWLFVLESEDVDDIYDLSYTKEPKHLLQNIEPLFYEKEK